MSARSRQITTVLLRQACGAAFEGRLGLAGGRAMKAALARRARLACEELGTSFIKIGQLISVRPDVFSAELVFELEKLRDSVPPLDAGCIRGVILSEFGRTPEELFASFENEPVASASIAQVHRATLREESRPVWGQVMPAGSLVVVKIIKPGVEEGIVADLEMARRFIRRVRKAGFLKRLDADSLLDQIEASLRRELDMRLEGRTADRFAFNFRHDPVLIVPRVVWARTTRRVLTMEYIDGWPLSDLHGAKQAGVDTRALALHGAAAFMSQVLVHGLFHADLHHANLFATPDGRIAYLDFGIFGTLTPMERESVAHVLAALVYRDADRALRHSAALGVRIRPEKVQVMRAELGRLMDRTLGEGGKGAGPDIRHFGMGFISLLHRYGVDIPVGYSLLVKSLVTVEGVSRELYPEIDIMEVARPFVTRVIADSILRPDRLREKITSALQAAAREFIT